jgi:predicted DNA-binding transcriptional regulator AlpA
MSKSLSAAADALPSNLERWPRLRDLLDVPAISLGDVALMLDVPRSTIDKLHAQGRGPRTFLIGRRVYCRQADLRSWIDVLATTEDA